MPDDKDKAPPPPPPPPNQKKTADGQQYAEPQTVNNLDLRVPVAPSNTTKCLSRYPKKNR